MIFFFFKILFILERWNGKAKERERNIDVQEIHQSVASHMPPTWDSAHNPGMWPDLESNWWPFGLQAGTQSLSHTILGNMLFFILDYANSN